MGLFSSKSYTEEAVVSSARNALSADRLLLVATIASVIKKHHSTLEDKMEQYVDEDEYGNTVLRNGLQSDLVYFSERVVLPALEEQIRLGKTKYKSVGLILMDTLHIRGIPDGITYNDPDRVVADKILHSASEVIDDRLLYNLEVLDATETDVYVGELTDIFIRNPSLSLNFTDKLKASKPMQVTPFVALVCRVWFSMWNNRDTSRPHKRSTPQEFTGNDPYKYEEFIKELLRGVGFTAKRTRGSGDYGVDVIASKNGRSYAIQCKLYNRPVGTKAVQEIVSGRIFYKTDHAIVVSDNSFTPAAKTLARKSDVILIHHKNLLQRIVDLTPSGEEGVM